MQAWAVGFSLKVTVQRDPDEAVTVFTGTEVSYVSGINTT